MKFNRGILTAAAAVVLAGFTAPVSAQVFQGLDFVGGSESSRVTSMTNSTAASNSFQSFLSGAGTETFESFVQNSTQPFNLTFPGVVGGATLTGGNGYIDSQGPGTNGVGRYPVSGLQYMEVQAGAAAAFNVTFANAVAAFGFWGVDIGDFAGTLTLRVFGDHIANPGSYTDYTPTVSSQGGSVLFWGLIDTGTFTRVSFLTTPGTGDYFAFDDMTVGTLEQVTGGGTVPEPATMTLLATGLAGMAAARRRKKNNA